MKILFLAEGDQSQATMHRQLRDAILNILSDEELKKRFGEDGGWLVREEFGWDEIVKRVAGVYSALKSEQR